MKINKIDYNIKDDTCYFSIDGNGVDKEAQYIATLPFVTWILSGSTREIKGLMIRDYSTLTLRQQTILTSHIIEFISDEGISN